MHNLSVFCVFVSRSNTQCIWCTCKCACVYFPSRVLALYEKMRVSDPSDLSLRLFWARARLRLIQPVPLPDLRDMWPGQRSNIWEYNREHFGLALTWGLMHIDQL